MRREEAIRRMECCRDFLANNYSDMGEPNVTAFNMAIKALAQEPCITWVTGADGAKIAFWDVPVWKVTKICEILGQPQESEDKE